MGLKTIFVGTKIGLRAWGLGLRELASKLPNAGAQEGRKNTDTVTDGRTDGDTKGRSAEAKQSLPDALLKNLQHWTLLTKTIPHATACGPSPPEPKTPTMVPDLRILVGQVA